MGFAAEMATDAEALRDATAPCPRPMGIRCVDQRPDDPETWCERCCYDVAVYMWHRAVARSAGET